MSIPKKFTRRAARLAILGTLTVLTMPALAAYPDKPIRLLVGYAPGGSTDIVARALGAYLSTKWGQQVVVDNKPGASGMIAAEQVVRSRPDGYTLLFAYTPEVAINKLVFKSMRYDPQSDLAPIALAAEAPLVLVAGPKIKAANFAELVALKSTQITYGSPGVGGQQHMAGDMLARLTGLQMTHVPYRGTGLAVADLIGGQIDTFFATTPPLLPHIQSGKLKPLAVAGPRREKLLPDVPTTTELGYPKLQLTNWFGLFAPKGMPKPVSDQLGQDVMAALKDPALVKQLEAQGLTVSPLAGPAFAAFIDAEIKKYTDIVAQTGITAE